jgi:hypothetical protein
LWVGQVVMGKFLFFFGLAIAALGLVMMVGVPIGRLPGDLVVRRGNFTFYFPIVTSLVISVVLTLVMMFLRR